MAANSGDVGSSLASGSAAPTVTMSAAEMWKLQEELQRLRTENAALKLAKNKAQDACDTANREVDDISRKLQEIDRTNDATRTSLASLDKISSETARILKVASETTGVSDTLLKQEAEIVRLREQIRRMKQQQIPAAAAAVAAANSLMQNGQATPARREQLLDAFIKEFGDEIFEKLNDQSNADGAAAVDPTAELSFDESEDSAAVAASKQDDDKQNAEHAAAAGQGGQNAAIGKIIDLIQKLHDCYPPTIPDTSSKPSQNPYVESLRKLRSSYREIAALVVGKRKSDARVKELTTMIGSLDAEKQTATQDLAAQREEHRHQLQEQLQQLQEDFQRQNRAKEAQIQQLTADRDTKGEEVTQLQAELERKTARIKDLAAQLKALADTQASNQALEADNAKLNADLVNASDRIATMTQRHEEQVGNVRRDLDNSVADVTRLEWALSEEKRAKDALTQQLNAVRAAGEAALRTEQISKSEEIRVKNDRILELTSEKQTLERDLARITIEFNSVSKANAEFEQRLKLATATALAQASVAQQQQDKKTAQDEDLTQKLRVIEAMLDRERADNLNLRLFNARVAQTCAKLQGSEAAKLAPDNNRNALLLFIKKQKAAALHRAANTPAAAQKPGPN